MTRRDYTLFGLLCVIWGIPYLFIKFALVDFSPATIVLLRTSIAALIMVPIAIARGELKLALKAFPLVLVFALVEMAGPWLLLNDAETRISSGLGALMIATTPLMGTLIGAFLGDRSAWHSTRLYGLALGFAGVVGLVWLDLSQGHADVRSIIQLVIVSFGYAAAPTMAARKLAHVSTFGVIALSVAIVAVIYLIPGIYTWPSHTPSAKAVSSVLVLGVVCTALAFFIFFTLLERMGAVRITLVTYINPAVAVALGIIFLSEPITIGTVIGFPLVLIGSWYATKRPTAAHTPLAAQST
ncbi:putative DMT superfamily transporter inner membrane protein [mine drainage metagenome]|uniref:Putative DMT superfamily transporter inner membrane protein n=1 Tax=mine drainage metagenome TaxID=410659 RepID=A0A1J5QDW9_9ZZZZ